MSLFFFVLQLLVAGLVVYLIVGGKIFAPWVPTMKADFKRINDLSELKPGSTFIELGCGDARVCIALAEINSKVQFVGIEKSFIFYLIAQARVLLSGAKNVKIVYGDALKYDLSTADVVYVFGMAETVEKKIIKKIEKHFSAKKKLISYVFKIDSLRNKEFHSKPTENDKSIYVYQF